MKLDIQLNRPQKGHRVNGTACLHLHDKIELSSVRSKLSAFATVRIKEDGHSRRMVNRLLDQIPIDIEHSKGPLEAGRHEFSIDFHLPFIMYPSKVISIKDDSIELVFMVSYVLSVAMFAEKKDPNPFSSEEWSDDEVQSEQEFVQCASKVNFEVPQSLDAANNDSIAPGFNSIVWQEEAGCCFQASGCVIMSLRTPGVKVNGQSNSMHIDLHIDNQSPNPISGVVQIKRKATLVASSEDDPIYAEQILCKKPWGPVNGNSIMSRSVDLPFSTKASIRYAGEKSPRLMQVQDEHGDRMDDFGTFTFVTEDYLELVCKENGAVCRIKLINNGKN